jgi:hypothetical protein
LRTPIRNGRGDAQEYWARNYDRTLVCTNDDPNASGHVQWLDPILTADKNGAFGPGRMECARIMSELDDHKVKTVRVSKLRSWEGMRETMQLYKDGSVRAVALRGHGDHGAIQFTPELALTMPSLDDPVRRASERCTGGRGPLPISSPLPPPPSHPHQPLPHGPHHHLRCRMEERAKVLPAHRGSQQQRKWRAKRLRIESSGAALSPSTATDLSAKPIARLAG